MTTASSSTCREALLQVRTARYTAGAVFSCDGVCTRAAPIIKWMVGRQVLDILNDRRLTGAHIHWC